MVPAQAWKEDKINLLERLWQAGYTSSAVADEMQKSGYNVTRNAVIGKVHRMGFTRLPGKKPIKAQRAKPKQNGHKPIFLPRQNGIKVIDQRHKGATMQEPKGSKRVPLTGTKEGDCRAIIGYRNGLLGEAICCGEITPWIQNRLKLVRSPWCEYHRNIYVQRETKR